jgi:DNA polymerase elongation subunit (family B)
MVANCSTYTKERLGVLPEITKKMFDSRKAYKNKMLAAKKEKNRLIAEGGDPAAIAYQESQVVVFDAMQNAFKVALNSLYGASANENFRYYNPSISEGITMTGQVIIRFIGNEINAFLNKKLKTDGYDFVIASDTDSAYLDLAKLVKAVCPPDMEKTKIVDFLDKFVDKHLTPYINERFSFLADYLNSYTNTLNMKREAIADRAIWRGKKNYIIQVYDNEGVRYAKPELKMMGVETARSSTPRFAKEELAKCYDILLNGTEDQLIKEVAAFKKLFMAAPVADIAFPRGVSDMNKWYDRTNDWKTGTPIHVKSAIMYNKLLRQHKLDKTLPKIKNGDKIKFVYLKEPNSTHNNAIAFFEELPPQFALDGMVDRITQYEKTFLHPLESLATLAKMETKKTINLSGFFSNEKATHQIDGLIFDVIPEAVKKTLTESTKVSVPREEKPKGVKAKKVDMDSFFS